jgi:hypothetical protein
MTKLTFACLLLAAVTTAFVAALSGAIERHERETAMRAYFKWTDVSENNGKAY